MTACIDTNKAWLTRIHGDIAAVYTWIDEERSLVLIPIHRHKPTWFIVQDSAAYKYADDGYLMQQAFKACEVMGFGVSPGTAYRIAKIIIEGLGDLIGMPNEAPDLVETAAQKTIGEMHILDEDGKTVASEAIHAPDGAIESGFTPVMH